MRECERPVTLITAISVALLRILSPEGSPRDARSEFIALVRCLSVKSASVARAWIHV